MPTLQLPRLRPDQWRIAQHPAKVKVICMGRRWGKTVMGGAISVATASRGGHAAWIVPTYKNSRPLWRWAEATVGPLKAAKLAQVNKSDQVISFHNGGFLGIYSADNIDGVRGEAFNLVVVDEAARIPEEAWTDSIMPTLADYNGDALLISTPKGRNWFWLEYVKAQADGKQAAAWTAPSSDNPNPQIKRAALLAKERVPERTYRQEWLAEFIQDGGGVFRRVRDAAVLEPVPYRRSGHSYSIGVDWAKSADFSVFTVLDLDEKSVAYMDRFNQIDYAVQVGRLLALCERYNPLQVIVERNSIGEPLIEQLVREGLPVTPFTTTNASKAQAIDALALAFERGDVRILNDPVLIGELEAYEMERLPSGMLRYSAPDGMHDDCVMSLALAWQAVGAANDEDIARAFGLIA